MRTRRTVIAVLAVAMAASFIAGCDVRVAGRRCTGTGFAQDTTHVLQCVNGRWKRAATKVEVALKLQAAFHTMPTVIAAGDGHACASMVDRSVRCWGRNSSGQLGDGTTTNRLTPVDAGTLRIESDYYIGGTDHQLAPGELALGDAYSCGISPSRVKADTTTSFSCWGAVTGPSDVLSSPQAIANGTPHGVTSRVFGPAAFCWALEFGATATCTSSQLILPTTTSAAVAGRAHECFLPSGGAVSCIGANDRGQLGNGSTTSVPVSTNAPVATGLTDQKAIRAGGDTTCSLGAAGDVRCWGANDHGQVGDGTTTDRTAPTVVPGLTVVTPGLGTITTLAVGRNHACAIAADRTLRCWGANTNGQLGDSTTTDRPAPVTVPGLSNVTAVAAGAGSTCAIADRGDVKQQLSCWGRNDFGQVGDGTTTERHEPTKVAL